MSRRKDDKAPGVGSEGTVERCRATTVRPYAVAAGEKECGKGASRSVVVFDTVCNRSAATSLERACCGARIAAEAECVNPLNARIGELNREVYRA